MARRARTAEGFNLAFIDVMSCGLGALMLILILVKYKTELPETQAQALDAELAQLREHNREQSQSVAELHAQLDERRAALTELGARVKNVRNQIAAQKRLNETLEQRAVKEGAVPTPVPVSGKRLQNYLLGLKVEGGKIVILIDSSASMTDERLIDIIKHKVSSPTARRGAPKWRRTKRIAEWLVARVPEGSDYTVIHFAERARVLGGAGWKKGADRADAAAIKTALAEVAPEGGTDLSAAVAAMHSEAAGFTDVYLVTDGLPTKGGEKFAGVFSGCASIVGRSTTISGKCRARLLAKVASDYGARAKVNVILLPLEGDPLASPAFWRWTSNTRGLLISPETSWP